jgi:RNA polymerase sigma-70 factor (ECF subfamily)
MPNTTSISLLDRLALGADDADWKRLLTIYRPFIEQHVRTYPDLANQADDIVQEVALVLMRELPVFQRQRQGSFRSWLRNITVNQLRTAARKVRQQPRAAGARPDVLQQIEELADPTSRTSAKWDQEHDLVILRKVLDNLEAAGMIDD